MPALRTPSPSPLADMKTSNKVQTSSGIYTEEKPLLYKNSNMETEMKFPQMQLSHTSNEQISAQIKNTKSLPVN